MLLTEEPKYVEVAGRGLGLIFAGSEFASWLMNANELEPKPMDRVMPEDIVFYLRDGQFKHAGLWLSNERICSKWGIGNLYEHGTFEVPISYGLEVRAYDKVTRQDSIEKFLRFAARKQQYG